MTLNEEIVPDLELFIVLQGIGEREGYHRRAKIASLNPWSVLVKWINKEEKEVRCIFQFKDGQAKDHKAMRYEVAERDRQILRRFAWGNFDGSPMKERMVREGKWSKVPALPLGIGGER